LSISKNHNYNKTDATVILSWSSGVVSVKQCGLLHFSELVRILYCLGGRNLVTRGGLGYY
jgi:hypothetical protein